ncbi:MAG: hypothetical protein K6E40_02390 [Desulfovibrio sp.]|nr:hypothetical protein [Desulfovibrio sp.]
MDSDGMRRLMLDRWHEDALRIGEYAVLSKWLARHLAERGIRPGDPAPETPALAGAELEAAVQEWIKAGFAEAERFYAERGFGKSAPRGCRVLKFRPGHGQEKLQ